LLQAALDNRFFRVTDFASDGGFPRHREIKDEVERLVAAIECANSPEALLAAAMSDPRFMRGSSLAHPQPYSARSGTRPIAFRQLELLLGHTIAVLDARALQAPSPTDRACRTVHGLYEALSARDGLLALRPDMVPDGIGNDRHLLFGEYGLFPHPAVRESRELIGMLWALAAAGDDARVAIDPNRVVPAVDIQDATLKDYWWGIRLTRANLDDLNEIGHTRHERRADAHDEFGVYPLLATDFSWHRDGNTKVLNVEETVPRDAVGPFPGPVTNRYLHSLRNTIAHRFVHVDGAIKSYDRAHYLPEISWPTADKGTVVHYRKMWRVEGKVDDAIWGRLVGNFFRGNELVIEYFGEVLDDRVEVD